MINTTEPNMFPVVIIGGGLAGLSAAAHLAARGVAPLLLDADRLWPGGRLAGGDPDTFTFEGRTWSFASEHGMHGLWGGYANLRALLERFTSTELQQSPGEEWINRWRREVRVVEAGQLVRYGWVPAPFHYLSLLYSPRFWTTITPLDFLSLPGFLFSTLWTLGLDPIKDGMALDGLMLDEFFRGWTPNLRATFTGLAVNLLAAPKEHITLTGMIAALRFYTMLRRDSWQLDYLPDNPHTCLIQPLIDHIRSSGGHTIHGAEAIRLEANHTGTEADEGNQKPGNWQLITGNSSLSWRVVFADQSRGGLRSVLAKHIILATNAPGAQRLLLNSPATAAEAAKLRFPGVVRNVTVRLWFSAAPREGAPAGMFTGDFLPDNFFWLHRLYDEFRAFHDQTGGSAIEVHLYANDDVLEQPENVLLVRCVDEIQRAFPELRGGFIYGAVRRNSRVHTAFRVPTAESLHVQTPWPNVLACGDWIGCDTPSLWLERATTTGIAAANTVLKAHGLEPYPILQPPPPEPLARGIELLARGFRKTVGRALVGVARQVRRKL